jgi:uncharacterized protein involved in exopolysaccharide biosynthesis
MPTANPTPTPPAAAHSASEFISLADLFHIVRQRWILASSSALVVAGLFAIVLLNQTPQYEAEASLVVELSADKVVNVQEVVENRRAEQQPAGNRDEYPHRAPQEPQHGGSGGRFPE